MGNHTMQQDTDRLGGLAGRGAMTGLAALALVGGGAGVAFADQAPADAGHDATQSQSQHQDSPKSADDAGSKGSDQKGSDQQGSDPGSGFLGGGLPLSSGAQALAQAPAALQGAAGSAPIVSSVLG